MPLTMEQARRIHLAAQGLEGPPGRRARKADVLAAIRRMAALQIDTISVVARSHNFVLWSRLGPYEMKWLDELLAEGAIFEQWAHAACFLPAEHFPYYWARTRGSDRRWQGRAEAWIAAHRGVADGVLERIRAEGPLRSADFERTDGRKGGGWWDWKEEKLALETLFTTGELMVARRQNFQRLYDLTERVRPDALSEPVMSIEEARRRLLLEAVRALGIARPKWVCEYLFLIMPKTPLLKVLRDLVAEGQLREVEVDGSRERWLMPADTPVGVPRRKGEPFARLLSPFDPIVWNRERASELFGFDYQIECYTPAPKRKYGYFTLPILFDGALVGRLDPKAHRKEGTFEVKALHIEDDVQVTVEIVAALRDVLRECAEWHGTPELRVTWANREGLAQALA